MSVSRASLASAVLAILYLAGCGGTPEPVAPTPGLKAFVGGRIINGAGTTIESGVVIVRDGRIEAVGTADAMTVPADAEQIDVTGRTLVPGFINTHGHVGATRGLESGPELYTRENLLRQLVLYARYGVTTVFSLGGDDQAGLDLRDEQAAGGIDRARLFVAGPVVTATTAEEAYAAVDEVAEMGADIVKIRVDDNLGNSTKMPEEAYRAVIERAHEHGLRVAAHLFYLDDAKKLVEAGADFLAHSVRDADVDQELIDLMVDHDVCLTPTLLREVSTFVYESRPDFFDDPFFLSHADPDTLTGLEDPERQERMRNSESAQAYKAALEVAMRNVKAISRWRRDHCDGYRHGTCCALSGLLRATRARTARGVRLDARAGARLSHRRRRRVHAGRRHRHDRGRQLGGHRCALRKPVGRHPQHPDDRVGVDRR